MTTVHKYPIYAVSDIVTIQMPQDADVVHVGVQNGVPCIWARVDPNANLVSRVFRFAGTGHPLDERVGKHVGSFFIDDGVFVFHLFEM